MQGGDGLSKPTPRDVRWLVDGLADSKRRIRALENRKPGLAYSSIEDGAIREFDKDGVQGSQIGKQPDGTHGSVVLNGPKPPKPTEAIVAANPGQGEARWNGKFVSGVVSPLDLKHVAAYFVKAGEFLDLSKQAGVMTGELGDNVQAQLEPGVYSVYLVSWSLAGRYSDASDAVPLLVPVPADMDAIQDALDDLDAKYDGVITEAGTLGSRLDQAEIDLDLAAVRLDDNDAALEVLTGTTLPALEQDLADAKTKLDPLPGLIADNKAKVDAAKSRLDTLDSTVLPGLEQDLLDANSRLSSAESTLAPLPGRLKDAESDLTDAFGQISTVDGKANLAAADAAKAQAAADALYLQTENRAFNPSFEDGLSGWEVLGPSFTAQADSAARDGAKVAQVAPRGAWDGVNTKSVPSAIGRIWEFSVWVRKTEEPESTSGNLEMSFRTPTLNDRGVYRLNIPLMTAGVWQQYKTTWTATTDEPIRGKLQVSSSLRGGKFQIDMVSLRDITDIKAALDAAASAHAAANTADGKAVAAASAASAAQSKADTAKSAADTAAADALAAAGIANSKGKTLIQSTAPAAADRNAVTLWIDTTGGANTPKRWSSGTTWVAVTDKAATDAATAAANAASAAAAADAKAVAAQTAAGNAQTTATNALTMAGSKSKVYYDTNPPSGIATGNGDLWRQRDAGNNIIGEWRWNGTPPAGSWVKTMISSDTISHLDVGKLTAGAATIDTAVINKLAVQIATIIELNADRITAGKVTASQIDVTNLAVSIASIIKLNASAITAGTINAARLDVNDLAARIATVIKLNASAITAGTIDTDRLNVQTMAVALATILSLNADRITAGIINTARLNVEEIAAGTAAFQTVDVKNLFATTGTMSEAVITRIFTDMMAAHNITVQMLAVGSFDNLVPSPRFESLDDWTDITGGGTSAPRIQETNGRDGGRRLAVPNNSTNGTSPSGMFGAPIPVEAGSSYRVSAWFVTGFATNGVARISVKFNGGLPDESIVEVARSGSTPASEWSKLSGSVEAPTGAKTMQIAGISSATTVWVYFDSFNSTRMADGEIVVDGSILARHADLESFAADTGFIADLTARIVKSDMFVGKEFIGGVFTGGTFQTSILPNIGVKFDGSGFRAYGPDGGEPIVEISSTGVNAFGITDPVTGESVVTFDNEGGASVQTLGVSGEARIDGVLVTGGDPLTPSHLGGDDQGSAGPVFNGRSLFGGTYMNYVDEHPAIVDGNSWMTPLPHGPKVNAWRERTGTDYWDGIGGQLHSRMMLTATLNAVANRAYLVTWQGPAIREGGTLSSGSMGAAVLRKSVPGGSVGAQVGTPLAGQRIYLPAGGGYFTPGGTTLLRCPEDIDEGKIMLGIDIYVNAGRKAESTTASGANLWSISAADMGLRSPYNDGNIVNLEKQGTAPATPPPAPAPDPVRQYTRTENNSWHRNFNQNNTPYSSSKLDSKAVQGRSPYFTTGGAKKSMIGFPSFASFVSGTAVVTKVEVYVYAETWHSAAGGTIVIGYHGATGTPGSFTEITADIKRQKMKRGEGRWITLPSSVHAAVKSSNFRGITLRAPSDSTNAEYYGYVDPSKAGKRARVRVTIRK